MKVSMMLVIINAEYSLTPSLSGESLSELNNDINWTPRIKVDEIRSKVQSISFKKMYPNLSSARQPFVQRPIFTSVTDVWNKPHRPYLRYDPLLYLPPWS